MENSTIFEGIRADGFRAKSNLKKCKFILEYILKKYILELRLYCKNNLPNIILLTNATLYECG